MAGAFNPSCPDTQIVENLKRQRAAREALSAEQALALNDNRIDRDLLDANGNPYPAYRSHGIHSARGQALDSAKFRVDRALTVLQENSKSLTDPLLNFQVVITEANNFAYRSSSLGRPGVKGPHIEVGLGYILSESFQSQVDRYSASAHLSKPAAAEQLLLFGILHENYHGRQEASLVANTGRNESLVDAANRKIADVALRYGVQNRECVSPNGAREAHITATSKNIPADLTAIPGIYSESFADHRALVDMKRLRLPVRSFAQFWEGERQASHAKWDEQHQSDRYPHFEAKVPYYERVKWHSEALYHTGSLTQLANTLEAGTPRSLSFWEAFCKDSAARAATEFVVSKISPIRNRQSSQAQYTSEFQEAVQSALTSLQDIPLNSTPNIESSQAQQPLPRINIQRLRDWREACGDSPSCEPAPRNLAP